MAEKRDLTKILVTRINDLESRIKLLEQRAEMLDDELVRVNKSIMQKIDGIEISLENLGRKIARFSEQVKDLVFRMEQISKKVDKKVSKEEFEEFKNLLELFHPLKSKFVTREEVLRLIEAKK